MNTPRDELPPYYSRPGADWTPEEIAAELPRIKPHLMHYALKFWSKLPEADRDDMVSDFVEALLHRVIPGYQPMHGKFITWYLGNFANHCRSWARAWDKRVYREMSESHLLASGASSTLESDGLMELEHVHEQKGLVGNPVRVLHVSELYHVVDDCLDRIKNQNHKRALRLQIEEGKSNQEIADLMGRTEEHVRTVYIKRGRRSLLNCVEKKGFSPVDFTREPEAP